MDPGNQGAQALGRFQKAPHPALRPFVVEYWGMARDLAAMGGFTITPDCYGELICCVGDMVAVDGGGREKLPACVLVGLLGGPLRVEAAGVVRCMGARLRPWTVGRISAGGSARGWEDAGGIFGHRLAIVSEMVGRCEWRALAEVFDDVLMQEVEGWRAAAGGIELAEQFVGAEPRPTAIVARERQITGRQVERRVRGLTRMSPKQLACLSRFQKVRDAIWADPAVDLARLAFAAGFADQAHMTRHFRRYSGTTPARFARESAARKIRPEARDVAFLQEAPGDGG